MLVRTPLIMIKPKEKGSVMPAKRSSSSVSGTYEAPEPPVHHPLPAPTKTVTPTVDGSPEPDGKTAGKGCELAFLVKLSIEPFCGCQKSESSRGVVAEPPADGGGREVIVVEQLGAMIKELDQRVAKIEEHLSQGGG